MDKQAAITDRERRYHSGAIEVRKENDRPVIAGLAAVFDKRSQNLGGFVEVIARGAFDDVLEEATRALFNHDNNIVLGRRDKGTLSLSITDEGLAYEATPPDTPTIRDLVLTPIEEGYIDQSSFQFRIAPGGASWEEDDDGAMVRTVTKVGRLYDVSPVTLPAYTDTSVAIRSLEAYQAQGDEDQADPAELALQELRDQLASAHNTSAGLRRAYDALRRI